MMNDLIGILTITAHNLQSLSNFREANIWVLMVSGVGQNIVFTS